MGKEKERRRRSTSSRTKSQVRILFSFFSLLSNNKGGQFGGENDEEGKGNKTPTDPLSCFQRFESSSGTSPTEARGGSPGRQKEKTW